MGGSNKKKGNQASNSKSKCPSVHVSSKSTDALTPWEKKVAEASKASRFLAKANEQALDAAVDRALSKYAIKESSMEKKSVSKLVHNGSPAKPYSFQSIGEAHVLNITKPTIQDVDSSVSTDSKSHMKNVSPDYTDKDFIISNPSYIAVMLCMGFKGMVFMIYLKLMMKGRPVQDPKLLHTLMKNWN